MNPYADITDVVRALSTLPAQIFSWLTIIVIGALALWMARYIAKNL